MAKKQANKTQNKADRFFRKLSKLKSTNWYVTETGAIRRISRADSFDRQCPITAVDNYAGTCVSETSDKRWGARLCAKIIEAADIPSTGMYRRKILKALDLKECNNY